MFRSGPRRVGGEAAFAVMFVCAGVVVTCSECPSDDRGGKRECLQ